jgi:hypothetical protein
MHPDPAGLAAVDPSNPQSWNRYGYVLNDPTALVDPLALWCVFFWTNYELLCGEDGGGSGGRVATRFGGAGCRTL